MNPIPVHKVPSSCVGISQIGPTLFPFYFWKKSLYYCHMLWCIPSKIQGGVALVHHQLAWKLQRHQMKEVWVLLLLCEQLSGGASGGRWMSWGATSWCPLWPFNTQPLATLPGKRIGTYSSACARPVVNFQTAVLGFSKSPWSSHSFWMHLTSTLKLKKLLF